MTDAELPSKLQRAVALHAQGQPAQAAVLYAEILQAQPAHADALHLLGVTETQRGQAEAGLHSIAKSLAINPNQPAAIANQGNALLALERGVEALACYEKALTLWPDYHLAAFGRGNALAFLQRPAEALQSFDQALAAAPNFTEALSARGGVLIKLKRLAEALASYDRAIELSPALVRAHLGRGCALLGLNAYSEAAASLDRALQLSPDFAEAMVATGDLKSALGEAEAAIAAYDRALQLNPTLVTAWFSRGLALSLRARFAEAALSFRRALDIDPQYPFALGACLHSQLQNCDWHDYSTSVEAIIAWAEQGRAADFPFSFLAVCDSPRLQRRCAEQFAELQPSRQPPLWGGERYGHERIRVAYISADFLEHPTSFLMAGVFEKHDRSRFETVGISLREDERSPTGRRVQAAFERFIVPGPRSDLELATLIRDLKIDIAVDLMGYTGEHRAALFAHRPAPIQVNYLGFPATTGAPHIDYLIADRFLIPAAHESEYSERIVYLPDCFQANDDRRAVAPNVPSRREMGLPESGFVWCSFHSSYKLNPPLFDIWARLVRQVPDSVLWLVGGKPEVERNLRGEALARGVGADRLVFAQPLPYPQHLARLSLADICLDTLPFNGGTTTSDALWAGVPAITCSGQSFAARMSGSLLQALATPELVTGSLFEYERLALELAREPARLADLRTRIARGRQTGALFDTDRFRRHLEAGFAAMMERLRCNLPPAALSIPRQER
jgi:protein O-GlcNAc transferase